MKHLQYRDDELFIEDTPLSQVAGEYGTPAFVYSKQAIEHAYRGFDEALTGLDHLVCYAVKANSNLAVLSVLARLGAGFDIVSAGELARVKAAGGDPAKVVFSGVGKRREEIAAALEAGVLSINVESAGELERVAEVAKALGVRAPISIRVNPDVDPHTHPYIATGLKASKFGIPTDEARALYLQAAATASLNVVGIDCHIGSQLTSIEPYLDALQRLLDLVDDLQTEKLALAHLNLGGGMGITYNDEVPLSAADYGAAIAGKLAGRRLKFMIEPGRAIVGEAGVLLTRVEYMKDNGAKRFAIVDCAMNDLIRPALYQAYQPVMPVNRTSAKAGRGTAPTMDVVGPVCESADFLALERPLHTQAADLLAIGCVGAYGFVMSSNYNTRPRACEVMVDGARAQLVRRRETVAELYEGESVWRD